MKENKLYFTNDVSLIIFPMSIDKVYDPILEKKRKENYTIMEKQREERAKEMKQFDSEMDILLTKAEDICKHIDEVVALTYI